MLKILLKIQLLNSDIMHNITSCADASIRINCADTLTVPLEYSYIDLLCSVAKQNEFLGKATSHCCITIAFGVIIYIYIYILAQLVS